MDILKELGIGGPQAVVFLLLAMATLWAARRIDQHIEKCDKRAINNERLTQWMADCQYCIAESLGVKIPPRPELEKIE